MNYLEKKFVIGLMLFIASCELATAQNASDIVRMFGGMVQSAVTATTQAQWNKVSQTERSCVDQNLRQQGSSLDSVIQQGVVPTDPRIADARSLCHNQLSTQSVQQAQPDNHSSLYVVDGLALGGQVNFDSDAYRSYKCRPSEQFASFTWCQKKLDERTKRGQFSSSYSVLHSQDGTALYINRYLEPAWFAGNEANDDVNGRSKKYGAPSRIIPMPQPSSVPNGMIVIWGNVVLEPLDENNVRQIASGQDVHAGFMIDHIGNFQRSAQQGLPIYRLTSGAGYVWAASWSQAGQGTLRFLAIDATAINSSKLVDIGAVPSSKAVGLLDTKSTPPENNPSALDIKTDQQATAAADKKAEALRIADDPKIAQAAEEERRRPLEEDAAHRAARERANAIIEQNKIRAEQDQRRSDAILQQQIDQINADRVAHGLSVFTLEDVKAERQEQENKRRQQENEERSYMATHDGCRPGGHKPVELVGKYPPNFKLPDCVINQQ